MSEIIYIYAVIYHNGRIEKKEAKSYREEDDSYIWTLADGSEEKELKEPIERINMVSFLPFDPK